MVTRQITARAAALLFAGTFAGSGAWAQELLLPATVIVACDHGGQRTLATKVSGIELAGGVPERLAAALQAESSCARTFNRLARGGYDLINRLAGPAGDFDGDGDVDGRDFLIWQRNTSAPPAPTGAATVLVKCDYLVADGLVTRVVGREFAGTNAATLGGALAPGSSCAQAFALLAGAGFGLLSAAPAPTAEAVDASDFNVWRNNFGAGP